MSWPCLLARLAGKLFALCVRSEASRQDLRRASEEYREQLPSKQKIDGNGKGRRSRN